MLKVWKVQSSKDDEFENTSTTTFFIWKKAPPLIFCCN